MKNYCALQTAVESIVVGDIVLSLPTPTQSAFLPGALLAERTLRVVLNTDTPFPLATILKLKLTTSIDENGVKSAINPPISASLIVADKQSSVYVFTFTGAHIPLPKNIIYLPNTLISCADSPSLQAGKTSKYGLLLHVGKAKCATVCVPGTPLLAHVISGASCDIKCEVPSVSQEPSDDTPIEIYCQDTKKSVFASLPHCVTHCQAPRPIVQYYKWSQTPLQEPLSVAVSCTNCFGNN